MNNLVFIGIAILLVLVSCVFLFFSDSFIHQKEGFIEPDPDTGKYDIEEINKKAVIPLDIYQTWHTKDLPPKMRECVEKLKKANPEFTHHLYDENDCREFIKNNFESDVLEAFDGLIPLAYKADLWRYCILYKKGGIYLDIKFEPIGDFKFIELVDREHFVLDRPYFDNPSLENELQLINSSNYYGKIYDYIDSSIWENKKIGLYNALLICKPNNLVLFECIQDIVKNVKNKFYGYHNLYPTGPGLLGKKYFKGDMNKIKDIQLFNRLKGDLIITKNKEILKHYNEYRKEQKIYGKSHTYYKMWHERKIYKE